MEAKTKRNGAVYAVSLILTAAYTAWLLFFGAEAKRAAYEGLTVCRDVILTAVFPFGLAADLLVSSGFCRIAGKYAGKPLSAALGLSREGAGVFLLGTIGGFPAGAAAASELYRSGCMSRSEAEALVSYTNNATPAFAAVFVGGLLGSRTAGFFCYAVCIFSAFAWGLTLRKKTHPAPGFADISGSFSFTASLSKSAFSAVVICADVIVFRIVSDALAHLPGGAFMSVFPEITNGVLNLSALISDPRLKAAALCALTSFSGLCAAAQAAGAAKEAGLRMKYYYIGKPVQAFTSFFTAYLIYPLFFS